MHTFHPALVVQTEQKSVKCTKIAKIAQIKPNKTFENGLK